MKVTFLGTGTSQGVPVIGCPCAVCQSEDTRDKRLRTSVMIETQGKVFVIDTGPDFRQQMLSASPTDLTAVVFTHQHKDHVAGMDDVRAFNYTLKRPVEVYATLEVQAALKREFYYVFEDEKYPGVPDINLHTISNQPFVIEGVEFIPIQVYHHNMPVLGFRVEDFTYITDANRIPDEEKEKVIGSKALVLNALRKSSHLSHFTLEEAIAMMEELGPQEGYFTHISHQLGKHEEVEGELPEPLHLAYDGLVLNL